MIVAIVVYKDLTPVVCRKLTNIQNIVFSISLHADILLAMTAFCFIKEPIVKVDLISVLNDYFLILFHVNRSIPTCYSIFNNFRVFLHNCP